MGKTKKIVTRHGVVPENVVKFGTEERFQWQNPKFISDVAYDIPVEQARKSVVFPADPKRPLVDNPDAAKNATGPGSYDVSKGFNVHSEFKHHGACKFSIAQRQSMDMKTPSPGAVYNIEKCYSTGPDRGMPVGFNLDSRKPLYDGEAAGANADPVYPKLPKGISITIGKRFTNKMKRNPSPSYDPYKYMNFQTGPKYSFGAGRANRWGPVNFLPEID